MKMLSLKYLQKKRKTTILFKQIHLTYECFDNLDKPSAVVLIFNVIICCFYNSRILSGLVLKFISLN